jgi:hypothetical protein|nr:hypothetical protein [Nitrosomonas nitrosa]
MNDDHRKIVISRIIDYKQAGIPPNESIPPSPFQRWLFYLLLIPVAILMLVLGAFFFSIFLALFVIAAIGVGIRLWWLRRKLQKAAAGQFQEETHPHHNVDIEDAEIIETKTNKSERK